MTAVWRRRPVARLPTGMPSFSFATVGIQFAPIRGLFPADVPSAKQRSLPGPTFSFLTKPVAALRKFLFSSRLHEQTQLAISILVLHPVSTPAASHVWLTSSPLPAEAANIVAIEYQGRRAILVEDESRFKEHPKGGHIKRGDAARFEQVLRASMPVSEVLFNSAGGSEPDGLAIGRTIRKMGLFHDSCSKRRKIRPFNALGGTSVAEHEAALRRIEQAGGKMISVAKLFCELQRAWSRSGTVPAFIDLFIQTGGTAGIQFSYDRT